MKRSPPFRNRSRCGDHRHRSFVPGSAGQLVVLQNRYSLPAVFGGPELPRLGGLMGDGANMASAFHDLANYAGRILKGARPEDLPVEQTIKIAVVINLKTAQALGLTIPQSVLGRADEVIE